MKFGMITTDWGEHADIRTMLTEIRETGWDGCEMRLTLDWMGCPERMRRLAEETECRIFCLASETPPVDPNHWVVQSIMRLIEYAEAIDVENVMIFPPLRPACRAPTQSEYDRFAEAAEKLAEYGSGLGITVSFHHHVNHLVERISEVEIILEQTRYLKLMLDGFQTTMLGDDFAGTYRKWRDRIHYVHLHDTSGLKLLDLGEGTVPLAQLLGDLKAVEYDGWVVTHGGSTDRSAVEKARVCREYLRSLGY